jgi:hypothetical protein
MRIVELLTSDLKFVARVEVKPFPDRAMPTVLGWGSRLFVAGQHLNGLPGYPLKGGMPPALPLSNMGEWVYIEVFGDVSFTPSPGLGQRPASTEKPIVDVFINGTKVGVPAGLLSYEDLCVLADEDLSFNPSATWRVVDGGVTSGGGLSKGQGVVVRPDMRFTIHRTGNA